MTRRWRGRSCVASSGSAARVAIDNERLEAVLLAHLRELRESRARIVEAGDATRRRLERDLHDGVQQRLLALTFDLRIARLEAGRIGSVGPGGRAPGRRGAGDHGARDAARPCTWHPPGDPVPRWPRRRRSPGWRRMRTSRWSSPSATSVDTLRPWSRPRTSWWRRASRRRCALAPRTRACGVTPSADLLVVEIEDDTDGPFESLVRLGDRIGAIGGRLLHGASEPGPGRWLARGGAMRVVVADDVMLMREGIVHLLRDAGVEVVGEAADARRSCASRTQQQPDVVVVDIRMPPTHTDEGLVAAGPDRRGAAGHRRRGAVALRRGRLRDGAHRAAPRRRGLPAQGPGVGRFGPGGCDPPGPRRARPWSTPPSSPACSVDSDGTTRWRCSRPASARSWRLVAEGYSNGAIAKRLTVTLRTVESHTYQIFQKLGLEESPDRHRRVLAVLALLRA